MGRAGSAPAPVAGEDGAGARARASRVAPRWAWPAGVAALVAIAAAAVVLWQRDGGDGARTPGPLHEGASEGVAFGQPAGERFAYGLPVAVNHGDRPAVLERISLVQPDPGLRLLFTRVGGPQRKFLWSASSDRWPDPGAFSDVREVRGFALAPQRERAGERGVELIFVLRADEPGRYGVRGVAVEYRVGDTPHRALLDYRLNVCVAPRGRPVEQRCPLLRD